MAYLFTDESGKLVELSPIPGMNAPAALERRRQLQKITKKSVIAWAHMGGDNPELLMKQIKHVR